MPDYRGGTATVAAPLIRPTPHHIGCAVEDLSKSYAIYAGALATNRRTRSFAVASQHVHVCFIELADGFYLELVAPVDDRTRLASFLKAGFYHLCFLVDDLTGAREQFRAQKFAPLRPFASEAFGGRLCQFFVSPERHLIELAEMSATDFGEFFTANVLRGPDVSHPIPGRTLPEASVLRGRGAVR